MWVAVGGTALHYWNGYLQNNDFLHVASERHVSEASNRLGETKREYIDSIQITLLLFFTGSLQVGLAMGSLCVISGALYVVDTVLAFFHYAQ